MPRRVLLATVTTIATAALAVTMGATPASAANLGTVTWNGTSLSTATLTGAVGDTFTFTNTAAGVYMYNGTGSVSVTTQVCNDGSSPNTNLCFFGPAPLPGTSATVTITGLGQVAVKLAGPDNTVATLTISAASSGGSSATSSTPAPVVQQFGLPASGSCADAARADLNWGGAASGGWSASWARWMNGGSGGAVCSRTLQYSNSTGAWSAS